MSNNAILHQPRVGINNVGSYQISGRPFLTASYVSGSATNNGETKIEFPSVTRDFTVINKSNNHIRVYFDSISNSSVVTSKNHYITLPGMDDSYTFQMKVKEVYVAMENTGSNAEIRIVANLTSLDAKDLQMPSGSGINT